MLVFVDQMVLDAKPRMSADGYLVAMPRAARTGIQSYGGFEVGRPDLETVRVFRPEDEVFSKDTLASFGHKPVTVEHPRDWVDAKNWKKYAVGQTGGNVLRDGEFMRIEMALMDGEAIRAVEGGKVELSLGYSAELDFTPGVTADGQHFDATQRNIRGNHLAIVDSARGGSKLRVIDTNTQVQTMKTIIVDGISVEVSDTAAQVIDKSVKALETKDADNSKRIKELEDELAELKAKAKGESETKDASIATLQSQLADAALTPAKLDAAVKARASVIDSAKKVLATVVVDGKSDSEIRRQVVDAKLGETSKGWSDDQVAASFAALSVTTSNVTTYAKDFGKASAVTLDSNSAHAEYTRSLETAYLKAGA